VVYEGYFPHRKKKVQGYRVTEREGGFLRGEFLSMIKKEKTFTSRWPGKTAILREKWISPGILTPVEKGGVNSPDKDRIPEDGKKRKGYRCDAFYLQSNSHWQKRDCHSLKRRKPGKSVTPVLRR